MERPEYRRITLVWVALVLATVLSWTIRFEDADGGPTAQALTTLAILGVAFVKIHYVGMDFMELRHAPLALRLCFHVWAVGLIGLLVTIYLVR
jgi:hypothetical protein